MPYNTYEKQKAYKRKHTLKVCFDGKRKRLYGVEKRDYTGCCETCHKKVSGNGYDKLHYHHWDDSDIHSENYIKGVWVCWPCHQICEFIDKLEKVSETRLIVKQYKNLRKVINREFEEKLLNK